MHFLNGFFCNRLKTEDKNIQVNSDSYRGNALVIFRHYLLRLKIQ